MRLFPAAILLNALAFFASGQSTQGLISGRIVDSVTGNPISGASIRALQRQTGVERTTETDPSGSYLLALLSPGTYRVRSSKAGYQTQELHELELSVASTLLIPFRLRPSEDVWENKQRKSVFLPGNSVLPFYGPDVDMSRTGNFEADLGTRSALESSLSRIVDPAELRDLPLAGRDAYALLITLPAVTTDSSTGRGLGLTANGQRPSSSNYLLDGLENNNYLISGPEAIVAPEAIVEYRVSTNNYAAEYGRTSGFIANVVTRTGGAQWHGTGYLYFGNDALDANNFQRNRIGARLSLKDLQPGFSVAGPTGLKGLYTSISFEYLRFRSASAPQAFLLPAESVPLPPGSFGAKLIGGYRGPAGKVSAKGELVNDSLSPPDSIDRFLGLPRLEYIFGDGKQRVFARAVISNVARPDFLWSPYPGYSSPLIQKATGIGGGWLGTVRANLTNEARAGFTTDDLHFDRAHAELPVLASEDGATLPGSPSSYSYRNRTRSIEVLDNLVWASGKHLWKFGGGVLLRSLKGSQDFSSGYYAFTSFDDFVAGAPDRARVALSRVALLAGQIAPPQPERTFHYGQFFGFAQDSYRISSHLVINYGLRYEYYGAPSSTGKVKDPKVLLGSGQTPDLQLRGATVVPPVPGDQKLYTTDKDNWAGRFGFSQSLRSNWRTLLRGGFGTFYDRPIDNLWENIQANSFVLSTIQPFAGRAIVPLTDYYPSIRNPVPDLLFSRLYLLPKRLHSPMVQSWFLGVEHQVGRNLTLELNGLGSWGHRLFTTDYVNRGLYNTTLSNTVFERGNYGFSYYNALALSARRKTTRSTLAVAYTWSHSIDNQSEPLRGEFFDYLGTQAGASAGNNLPSTFSEQFRWWSDKGNSDFDQRHNLVVESTWQLPSPQRKAHAVWILRHWQFAQIAGFHSGFPFTITSGSYNRRPDLIDPSAVYAARSSVSGGVQLLNAAAFRPSPATRPGTLGRNALTAPGFYSLDLSLAKSIRLSRFGEAAGIKLRVDAFNVLNHANLGPPNTSLGASGFGVSSFGQSASNSTFPALVPLSENARRIQVLFRFEF